MQTTTQTTRSINPMNTKLVSGSLSCGVNSATLVATANTIRLDIAILKGYAKDDRARKDYSTWAFWMNTIKAKRRELGLVTLWLHLVLHAEGKIKTAPVLSLRDSLTTVADVAQVVARNCPTSQNSQTMGQ